MGAAAGGGLAYYSFWQSVPHTAHFVAGIIETVKSDLIE